MITVVGESRKEHPTRQGIRSMRTHHTTGAFDKVINHAMQPGLCRIRVNVKNKDPAGIEATRPEVTPVVGKTGVVGLIAPAYGQGADYLSIVLRVGVD